MAARPDYQRAFASEALPQLEDRLAGFSFVDARSDVDVDISKFFSWGFVGSLPRIGDRRRSNGRGIRGKHARHERCTRKQVHDGQGSIEMFAYQPSDRSGCPNYSRKENVMLLDRRKHELRMERYLLFLILALLFLASSSYGAAARSSIVILLAFGTMWHIR